MLITRETDYAIRCILHLAQNEGRIVRVTEIAQAMHIPKNFLAKIIQRLVRSRLLTSTRGAQGGFQLAKKPAEITLLAIIESIQRCAGINDCALDHNRCTRSATCSVHPVWVKIRKEVENRLRKQTILSLLKR